MIKTSDRPTFRIGVVRSVAPLRVWIAGLDYSGAVLERVKTEFQSQLEAYFREQYGVHPQSNWTMGEDEWRRANTACYLSDRGRRVHPGADGKPGLPVYLFCLARLRQVDEKWLWRCVVDCSGLIKYYLMAKKFGENPRYTAELDAEVHINSASKKGDIKTLPDKQVSSYERKDMTELFSSYEKMGGNSYVRTIYEEFMEWETKT